MIIKKFVEYFYPGFVISDTETKELKDGSVREALSMLPQHSYGFKFYKIAFTEDEGIKFKSDRLDESSMFYVGGKVYTFKQVKEEFPDAEVLISNMKNNGYKKAIKTRTEGWLPFKDNDIHLLEAI